MIWLHNARNPILIGGKEEYIEIQRKACSRFRLSHYQSCYPLRFWAYLNAMGPYFATERTFKHGRSYYTSSVLHALTIEMPFLAFGSDVKLLVQ